MAVKNVFRTVRCVLILMLCCIQLSCFCFPSYAQQSGSISITAVDKETDTPVTNAVFRIYKFATAYENDGSYTFRYDDSFESNGMEMGNLSDTYLPVHLTAFAQNKNLPYQEKSTDFSGRIMFDSLSVGAYLIVPMGITRGHISSSPFVVSIPMRNEATGNWEFNIDASPKIRTDKDAVHSTVFVVKKQWEGAVEHPVKVTVALLKDGLISEYMVLDSSNNWTYRWDELDPQYMWNVVEIDVPSGYKVTYDDSPMTMIITNASKVKDEETTTGTEDTSVPDKLVQTGQLNWPVPILAVAGLLLFSVGWAIINLGKKDEEAQ